MKNLLISTFVLLATFLSTKSVCGQTAELTIEVKGIKEAKGTILIAVSDSKKAETPIYDMKNITQKGTIVCLLKNIPIGNVDLSLFQDLNGNYKLDMDEQNIPIEPCFKKENIKINDTDNKLTVKLINVKEMMESKAE
ncbi:DUF2141 domain-containing protein [Massilibacteroides sp.]|uniref:DUF2141 domain-containing protein n=1 Tax=Massilibacteroides sp. TaxID=2034766 RepID=UPI00260D3807|nr:DUF2141 domain-containing protein [Massilibacteroides sp.]MDD4514064.1 DUF2141 domain-containing protein [Massilibacteroides sp.]